jgi:hypothetical protein
MQDGELDGVDSQLASLAEERGRRGGSPVLHGHGDLATLFFNCDLAWRR